MSTLTDEQYDQLAAAVAAGDITYTDEAADLPPRPDGDAMAGYRVRLPAVVSQRLSRVADRKGVKTSALLREYVEAGLAAEEGDLAPER